jgi:predicted dehydrogenase
MKKVRVGVVGVGRLGNEHARIYAGMKKCFLVGVTDTRRNRAREAAGKHKVSAFTDYASLFGKVEAVSIAVPTDLHYAIARDFLKRDVHVLLEKPITRTLEEAGKLVSISEKRNVILQVGHVERFNSALIQIERKIKNPRFIECHRLGPYQERGTEVSVVLDLMIHDIDIILSLVKSPVKRIDAVGVSILSAYEDIANARIVFANGAVANITSSRISAEKLRKIRIFEKDTYVSLDFLNQNLTIYKRRARGIIKESPTVERIEPLKSELEDFIDSISRKRTPLVPGRLAREALRVALNISKQIQNSSQPSGKT